MTQTLADLQRFAIPGVLKIAAAEGGLPALSVATQLCRAVIHLHGAHLTAWQPAGQAPVLWMSTQSDFVDGKPIRGGIPLCWPWFGPAAEAGKPAHGLVRLQRWTLASAMVDPDGVAAIELELDAAGCSLRYSLRLGQTLEATLSVSNRGAAALTVGEALHTYLAVGDVRQVVLRGLEGAEGLDRVAAPVPVRGPAELRCSAETDLNFHRHAGPVEVEDPVLRRSLRVSKSGSASTVVWNPWIAKAARMPDFGDNEWPGMLCVEAANALADGYILKPGDSHRLGTIIEVV